MKFNFLTIRNFLSIGNIVQSIRLDAIGLTLILGNNIDVANSNNSANNRNGVGKSTLLQALSYVLFDEPLSKIKMDNLINRINKKGMLVTLEFEVGGDTYRIERGRGPKVLNFYKNHKKLDNKDENDALGSSGSTQTTINNLISMNHMLFCHIVAMNTYTTPFLREKPPQQREIIEQLLGITKLSERDKKLVELIKETKNLVKEEEITIKAISDSNDRIRLAIENGEKESIEWIKTLDKSISELQSKIDTYAEIDFDAELILFDEFDAFQKEVESLSLLIKEEQKETLVLRKEVEHLLASKNDLEKELLKTSDSQIDRLKVEAKRCETEAEKGCDIEVAKLTADIIRCKREAAKTCDAEVDRLRIQAERRMEDASKKSMAAEEKMISLADILSEIENSDGHSCTTCGQNIDGTDHLQKILETLAVKADKLEKDLERDIAASQKLENEANDILKDIDAVRENHVKTQENWLSEIDKITLQIQTVEENHLDAQQDWLKKAEAIHTEIETAQNALETKKSSIQESITSLRIEIDELSSIISEREKEEDALVDSLSTMKQQAPKLKSYRTREDVWKARDKYNNLLKDVERERIKENPHESYVSSLQKTIQSLDYSKLNTYQDDLKHQDFIHKLLTAKDSFIRKKIIDQNLYLLNSKISKYVTSLGLPYEVKFMQDLSIDMTDMGQDFDFEQLSRGEMNRVNLSVSWSFRDVWEELNDSINLLFLDEVADNGTDGAGIEATLDILMKMAHKRSVFLISHKEELIGRMDKILMVHKEENFTRFELQE